MASATGTQHGKYKAFALEEGIDIVYPDLDDPVASKAPVKYEIVAIPGIGANEEWTWKQSKTHWLKDPNMLGKRIEGARISIFQFQSNWFGKGSVNQRFDNIANQLLYGLDRTRRKTDSKTPIIFICHSLGGIILLKALLTSRLRQANFPYIFPYVAGAIFLGTPFNGTNEVQGLVLGEHAASIGMGTPESLIKFLEKDSEVLRELVYDFSILASGAHMRLFCFYEQVDTDLKEIIIKGMSLGDRQIFKDISSTRQDLIVDPASATLTSFEKLGLQTSHFFLNKFDGSKNSSFRYVSEEIVTTVQEAPRILKSRQNALRQRLVDDQTCQIMRDHLGSGFSQVKAAIKGSNRQQRSSKAVIEMEAFKSWMTNATAKLLWVHGEAATGRQEAVASSAIEYLEASRASGHIVASFYCHQSEKQRRSLLGLLQLIVRQVIDANQDLAVHLLSDNNSRDTGKQAFDADAILKERILWDALLSMATDLGGETIYVVVYGVEQLSEESLPQFLELIKEFSDRTARISGSSGGPSLKWLLLSRSGRPQITKALKSRAAEINLEDAENIAQFSADLRNDISLRVNDIGLPSSLAYFVKRHIHSRAEGNWIYVNLVVQEVRNAWAPGKTHADIRELLESFPYGLTDMFEHVRRRVLEPTAESHEYTKEILRCRICAYVAPTILELAIMAGVPQSDREDPEILKDYIIRCGGFFTVDYNDRVEWIHPSAQDHLEEYAKDVLGLDLLDMQHGIIALRSLEYIHELVELADVDTDAQEHNEDEEEDESAEDNQDEQSTHAEEKTTDNASHKHLAVGDNDDEASHIDGVDEDKRENLFDDTPNYPIRHWIEHAKKADSDVLNEVDFNHAFWQPESEAREKWWKAINDVHGLYEQSQVSALHVAVILKFPALISYLLERRWRSDVERTDSEGFQPLYYACRNGDEDIVNALLGAGADLGHTDDEDKPTALHAAASFGHLEIVKLLLDRGADVNASSKTHGTALYAAIANHNNDIAKLLLLKGAKANAIGGSGKRAINIASLTGNIEGVQLLLDHGVQIDPDDSDYWYGSALGAAARNGHIGVVKLLLSKSWDPSRAMKTYGSFLTAAATYNHLEVLELLLERDERITVLEQALQAAAQRGYAPIVQAILTKTLATTYNIRHQKAFALAAFYGRTEVLKLLFDQNITQDQLDSALFQATDNEHEETVKLLLEQGASPNAEGPVYGFALAASAFDGTKGILKALIAKGADVNKRKPDSDYGTALQAAAYCGKAENVKLLISHGAALNSRPIGLYGNELQAAVHTGDAETIQVLLSHGANVNAQGGLYTYPIVAAVSRGYSAATEILLNHNAHVNVRGGPDNSPVICLAASTLRKEDLKPILKFVYDINVTCDNGTTALINCADACDAEGVKFLVDNDADVSIVSKSLGSALHAAAAQGDEDSCQVLIKAGALVNALGGPYGTALQAAAWADDIECVRELLGAGADPNIVGGEYGTALLAACENGSLEIVSELLLAGATINIHPTNNRYGTALTAASASGNIDLVSLLLGRGADVNLEGGHHGFPILAASWSADHSIVDLLLQHGANPSVGGTTWGSAIMAAAYGNSLDIIETLVEHNVNVHAQGGKYGNALQTAAMKADEKIVDYILDRAIDLVNVQGGKYHTPLIAAAYFDRLDIVEKLLNASADFRLRGGKYKSAVTAAAIRGNKAVLERFLKMGPPGAVLDEALVEAVAHRQTTSVDMLFKAGADVKTHQASHGSPYDALHGPEIQDENSDVEEDDLEEEEEDGEEEGDEGGDDEWEGDNNSTSGETEDGSVTNLQLEDEVSEEDKIQKLLDDAMARCKRNPSIKRFRTVKHAGLPKTLSFGISAPPVPALPTMPAAYASYVPTKGSGLQFSQPVWNPSAADQPQSALGMQQYHAEPITFSTSAQPNPLVRRKQVASSGHATPQSQGSQDSYSSQYPFPSQQPQRSQSNSSATVTKAPRSNTPPSRKGSEDTGLKRSSKAMNRRSMANLNPGAAGRYQTRQSSGSTSHGPVDHSIAEQDFVDVSQQTPSLSSGPAGPYCPYPDAQQPIEQHFPPPLPPRHPQQFTQAPPLAYELPTSIEQPQMPQYPRYASPPPLHQQQHMSYGHVASPASSQTSFQGSHYAQSTAQSSAAYGSWDNTPRSSQASDLHNSNIPPPPKRWTGGGYEGEGYG